jgi:8-oxo-dGTP pyrophosphatase MutT (NUDIX family)
MWHPSDRLFAHYAAEQPQESEPVADVSDLPHTCSYCGSQEFEQPEDTGRGLRAICSACGGAMLRTEDGQWSPAGLNATHNHPRPDGDPASGGVGGAANVGVDPDRMNDASARHGSLDVIAARAYQDDPYVMAKPGDKVPCPTCDGHGSYEEDEPKSDGQVAREGIPDDAPEGDFYNTVTKPCEDCDERGYHVRQTDREELDTARAEGNTQYVKDFTEKHEDEPHPDRVKMPSCPPECRFPTARRVHTPKLSALNDEVPWCAHLYHGNCTYPGDKLPNGTVLGIPQDRGPCPWKHNAFQQAACPISAPGPMAVMQVSAALHEAMPSRKHPAPEDLSYDTYHPKPGEQYFDEAEESNPGWSHHLLRAHRSSVDVGGSQPHMVGSVYYSHQPDGPVPMVKVHKMLVGHQYRSQGVASAMQDELHRQYPGHFIDHGDRTADGHGWASQYEAPSDHIMSQVTGMMKIVAFSWDEIGDRHPHIYGDSEIHGEAADGADGPGIGDAANYLAHERPDDPDAEHHSVYDMDFHEEHVDPRHIDYSPSGRDDYRVSHAMEGYREHPDTMPPLVLVKRHHVYQVADGHHRAEAADAVGAHVRAYVAHSPYPDEPFRDGEKGPFHRAEPIDEALHHEAAWADVRNKAKRIRREGGVTIVVASTDGVAGEVRGDTHVYETAITWVPGTTRTAYWTCGCMYGAYAHGPRWDDRPCSHVLAMRFEAQSRSAHGREIEVDQKRPEWLKPQTSVMVQYERPSEDHPQGRDLTRRAVPPGNMRSTWDSRSRTRRSSLERTAAIAQAQAMFAEDQDPAEVIEQLVATGATRLEAQVVVLAARGRMAIVHTGKRCPECGAELDSTAGQCDECGAVLADRSITHRASWGDDEQRCPHCGGYIGPSAFKVGKCPHCGHALAHKTGAADHGVWYHGAPPERAEQVRREGLPKSYGGEYDLRLTSSPQQAKIYGDMPGHGANATVFEFHIPHNHPALHPVYEHNLFDERAHGVALKQPLGPEYIAAEHKGTDHIAAAIPPGYEGAQGPFEDEYSEPHVYARDIHSGAGNCVCGGGLGDSIHLQAAPGVDVPEHQRTASSDLDYRPHRTQDARSDAPIFGKGVDDWGLTLVDCPQCGGQSGCGHCGGTGQVISTGDTTANPTPDQNPVAGDTIREDGISDTSALHHEAMNDYADPIRGKVGPKVNRVKGSQVQPGHVIPMRPDPYNVGDSYAWQEVAHKERWPEGNNYKITNSSGSHYTVVSPHEYVQVHSDTGPEHTAAKTQSGPSVAGVALKAADTGRILMLQRGLEDEKDPARGLWEHPGGHIEPGDKTTLHAGLREWEEEVGQPFPEGGVVTHAWTSPNGVYQGHVVVIPRERDLVMHDGRVVPNPDDPKGDKAEQAAWWHPDHARKNPALRPEVKATPWNKIKEAGVDAGLKVAALLSREGAAWDSLYSLEESQPVTPPPHSNSENPASTGFLTNQDPASWSEVTKKPHHLLPADSLDSPLATLHSVPEGALPFTDGDAEDSTSGTEDPYNSQTDTESLDGDTDTIPDAEMEGSPMENLGGTAKRSVAEIVEQFQRTAGAVALQSGSEGGSDVGFSDGEIAAKAKERLAGMSKTALKNFSFAEQQELIGEGQGSRARNFGDLSLSGTHYEALQQALDTAGVNDDDILIL